MTPQLAAAVTTEMRVIERDFDEAMAEVQEKVKVLHRAEGELAAHLAGLDEVLLELKANHGVEIRPTFGPLMEAAHRANRGAAT